MSADEIIKDAEKVIEDATSKIGIKVSDGPLLNTLVEIYTLAFKAGAKSAISEAYAAFGRTQQ